MGQAGRQARAVAAKLSFIAATTFALEAVLDMSAQLADAGSKDIRIEAALAKLWSSEMAYKIADELVQIRGGRGYETADSMAARGERAVPAEQILRDLRINRIFEGSTEIMHLLIAREAVDAHLAAAGALADQDASAGDKAKAAAKASGFYAKWLPKLVVGQGTMPMSYGEFGDAGQAPAVRRAVLAQAGPPDVLRDVALAGQDGVPPGFLGRIVDIGAELFAMAASVSRAEMIRQDDPEQGAAAYDLADAFCRQSRVRVEELFGRLWNNTDDVDGRIADRVLDGDFVWLEDGIIDQSEGTGPWISTWEPGPSKGESLARRY